MSRINWGIWSLCGSIAVLLCIVLANINRESLWGDEAFSVFSIGGADR